MNRQMRGFAPQRDLYNRRDTRVEYQLFSQEYFSGADMHIYFGDIWVDEITDLSFQMQEEVLPIYGYNSYTFDELARGRRMISGMFTMNFTSVGYLQKILDHADAINHVVGAAAGANPINIKNYDKYRLDEILALYGKDSFEQIANEYEEAIWGKSEMSESNALSLPNQPYFQRNNKDGFDIRIHYGPVEETYRNNSVYRVDSQRMKPNLTVESLNGVQITGLQKSAGTSGQGAPVQEIYTFIAQDLNRTSIKG
ncbi:MAG: hypothetical protein IJ880_04020 [Bacilli bacterium]|nr:hypothetical protein [Bacilli bacterium]MBR3119852.1 hypothetical protein [Oceanobacillus sp.]